MTGVTYSLEADSSGDGIQDCVCMRKVWESASLNAFEVQGLKTDIITFAVNHKLTDPDKQTYIGSFCNFSTCQ